MITDRTLKRWRQQSLWVIEDIRKSEVLDEVQLQLETSHLRILELTQELMDRNLLDQKNAKPKSKVKREKPSSDTF